MDLVDTVCGRMRLKWLMEKPLFLPSEAGKGVFMSFGRDAKMMKLMMSWEVNSVKG